MPEQGTNHGAGTCAITDDINDANGVAVAGVDDTYNSVFSLRGSKYYQ